MQPILFSLPASLETYQALGNFIYKHGLKKEMFEVVDEALSEWMAAYEEGESQRSAPTLAGYQWKSVFLPEGTTLRNVYKGASHLARVEEGQLRYLGKSVSPAQFVNQVGGAFRNAWTTLWIRFPDESEWKRAVTLRNETPQFKSKQERIRVNKNV